MDGASSQPKQKRLVLHSVTTPTTPLEQLASAFCATDQSKSHIDFQLAERDSDEPQAPGYEAIPTINQAKDTLLSIVNPHLWRNQCQRFTEKCNGKSYWSQQGSLLSLDHGKLLAEATRNSKASDLVISLCSSRPEQQYPNISRISGTRASSVSSGGRPSNIKTRIKWTVELHKKFVNCVNLLGGAEKISICKIHYGIHTRFIHCFTKPDQGVDDDDLPMLYLKSGMQVKEILQMQLEVQRHLCEQLEIQQNLQQAIQEQGKQIQMMLEQLKKTNKA
ncbi:MYB-CC type transcription factor [Theobroma cacao]|nr:MYB-CC type transcription factor [Theobroma cacao]